MKSFDDFRNSLTVDVMNKISEKSKKKALEQVEKVYHDDEKLGKQIAFSRYYSTIMTLEILEKYHNWNNE